MLGEERSLHSARSGRDAVVGQRLFCSGGSINQRRRSSSELVATTPNSARMT